MKAKESRSLSLVNAGLGVRVRKLLREGLRGRWVKKALHPINPKHLNP